MKEQRMGLDRAFAMSATSAHKRRRGMSDKLSAEVVGKLREPILVTTEEELKKLEEFLGVELIAGIRDEYPGKLVISRLALANAFINDADLGLRLAIGFDKESMECTGVKFIRVEDQYSEEELTRAREVSGHLRERLEGILSSFDEA